MAEVRTLENTRYYLSVFIDTLRDLGHQPQDVRQALLEFLGSPPTISNAGLWNMKPLDGWTIVGMNHYHIKGERRLFVAMTKDGRCITEEGPDDQYLWNRLWHKAVGASGQSQENSK